MVCSYEYANDPAVFIKVQKFLDLATTTGLPRRTSKVVFSKEFFHIFTIQPYTKFYDERYRICSQHVMPCNFLLQRLKLQVPRKCSQIYTRLRSITSQNTVILTVVTVRNSKLK